MVRRYGPTLGAGVVVQEDESQPSIQIASLGNTAYTGIMKKGPVGKVFRCGNKTEFLFRAGGIIPESLLADAAIGFFDRGRGAGAIYGNRVTDGTERKATLTLLNRKSLKSSTMKVSGGNGGRWAGKKAFFVRNYASVTATTLTLDTPPTLLEDELEGAVVTLPAVPGKSYVVLGNSTAGVLQFASDTDLVTDIGAETANKTTAVSLANSGEAIGIKITEATINPTTDWRMEVWLIEGGIGQLIKEFDNLSSDPDASNYYQRKINDDSDSEFTVTVEDLHIGAITADVRPANYAGKSTLLTATVLTVEVSQAQANSALGATAKSKSVVDGGSMIYDKLTLTNTAAGVRATGTATFAANPSDGDTMEFAGETFTFKTVVADEDTEILIGADAEGTIDNAVAFILAKSQQADHALYELAFAEKASASTMAGYAMTAGAAGNSLTTGAGAGTNPPTWASGTFGSGVDQTWSVVSEKQPYLTLAALVSGVAYTAPNVYGFGFTLVDVSRNSTKTFGLTDTITVEVYPLESGALAGGSLLPKASEYRQKFPITGNTATQITVKTGADMTTVGQTGDDFRVEYVQQLGGGYDGVAGVGDLQYEQAYDTSTSPLKGLRGKNLGLVKLATPGITSTAVQKAGVAFSEFQNWQYRVEIPANIVSESAAEQYVNETIGRNLFEKVQFPTYAYVTHPSGNGLKLISMVGDIHGAEADVARQYNGFHKAAAGTDVTLPRIRKLPGTLDDVDVDQELLNPQGIGMIRKVQGNYILWGDRIPTNDPSFIFAHHRELLSHYENTFLENFDFIIYAINQKQTQTRLISAFVSYFVPEFAKGAVRGKNVLEAIKLKIDDENNTDTTRAAGDMYAELSPRLADTVERFIIKISKRGVEEIAA